MQQEQMNEEQFSNILKTCFNDTDVEAGLRRCTLVARQLLTLQKNQLALNEGSD